MAMPKPSPATLATFRNALGAFPGAVERKMFGQLAGFVNGNMFAGVFGDAVNVRLDAAGRDEALRAGAMPFEPMPGRPMKEYVVLPAEVFADPDQLRGWVAKAYAYVSEAVPAKAPKEAPAPTPRRQ